MIDLTHGDWEDGPKPKILWDQQRRSIVQGESTLCSPFLGVTPVVFPTFL
jgi:hypothetical protein